MGFDIFYPVDSSCFDGEIQDYETFLGKNFKETLYPKSPRTFLNYILVG